MASEVEIANRALQRIGGLRITSLTQDSVTARSCNVAYTPVRDSELRAHRWSFAIARATLAADATAPSWGRANSFQLPSDFLKLIPTYPEMQLNNTDWVIEGGKILTNDSSPLYIRYIYRVTDPNIMDPLFREAFAARLAAEIAEEVTQSSQKVEECYSAYKMIIAEARKANAIEVVPAVTPDDTWITARL